MSGRLKFLSALNVLGWLVVMPILMVSLVSPFLSAEGLPGSAILDREASARVARIASEPKPASAGATSVLALAAAEVHARGTAAAPLAVLSDSLEPQGPATRIPGAAPVMVASLRQIVAGGSAPMRRAIRARKTSPTAVAEQVSVPAISGPTLSLPSAGTPANILPAVAAPAAPAQPPVRHPARPRRREKPSTTPEQPNAPATPPASSTAPAPSAPVEQHPGATNRSERAPEKRAHPEQSQSRGNGRN